MAFARCRHEGTKKRGFSGRKKLQSYYYLKCNSTFVDPTAEKPLTARYVDLDTTAKVLESMMEGTSVRSVAEYCGLEFSTPMCDIQP